VINERKTKNETIKKVEEKRTYYIYKYTNTKNNKIYVGFSLNPRSRQNSHKTAALNGRNHCLYFYNSIRKHGYDSFVFEIIEEFFGYKKDAGNKEKYWIKKLETNNKNKGYNISAGGCGCSNPNNSDTHKQCGECKKIKLRYEFNNDIQCSDGISNRCRLCASMAGKNRYSNLTDEQLYERNKSIRLNDKRRRNDNKEKNILLGPEIIRQNKLFKKCNGKCKLEKSSNEFYLELGSLDGLRGSCIKCDIEAAKDKYKQNCLKKGANVV